MAISFISVPAFARNNYYASSEREHYFGLYADGAYANLHLLQQNLHTLNGYGAGGGILYEYEWNNLMFNLGCGFLWEQGGYALNNPLLFEDRIAKDTHGTPYTLHTHMSRYDVIRCGTINIPILFGGNIGVLYMLGGLKVGINVVDKSQMGANITTYGEYDRYISPISQTSNHGYRTNVPLKQSYSFASNMNVRMSFEIGANLGEVEIQSDAIVKARIGLFVDYGLFVTQFQLNESFVDNRLGTYDFVNFQLKPILIPSPDKFMGNLLTGIKLTVLISGSNGQYQCRNCHILDSQWRPIRYKNKCVICKTGYE